MAVITSKDRSLYEQMCREYLDLKAIIENCCTREPALLSKVKEVLKCDVNSARKMSRVLEAKDLYYLLEKRNLISVIKVNLLSKLDPIINHVDFSKNMEKYRTNLEQHFFIIRRFYLEDLRYRDRRTLLEKEIEQAKLGEPVEETNEDKPQVVQQPQDFSSRIDNNFTEKYVHRRQSIFNLISKEICRNWSTFGRLMQLSDSSLEEIEFRYPRNVKAIVVNILEIAEKDQTENGRQFLDILLKALVEFRRNDLKIKIEKMLR